MGKITEQKKTFRLTLIRIFGEVKVQLCTFLMRHSMQIRGQHYSTLSKGLYRAEVVSTYHRSRSAQTTKPSFDRTSHWTGSEADIKVTVEKYSTKITVLRDMTPCNLVGTRLLIG